MQTKTITNAAIRTYKLPARKGPDGQVFGTRMRLSPGRALKVPVWYFALLLEEPGWAKRLDPETGIVRGAGGGVARLFEARIKQKREAAANAQAQERARVAEGQVSSLEQRLASLERDREESTSAIATAEQRARAAEARVAELERQLGTDKPSGAEKAAPPKPEPKAEPKPDPKAKDDATTEAAPPATKKK